MNHLELTGIVTKVYEQIITPAKVLVSRFVIEHSSTQNEAGINRLVKCRIFCVIIGKSLSNEMVNKAVNAKGFLSMNANRQIVFHVNQIQILD